MSQLGADDAQVFADFALLVRFADLLRKRDAVLKARDRLFVIAERTVRFANIRDRAGFAAPVPGFPVKLERFEVVLDG